MSDEEEGMQLMGTPKEITKCDKFLYGAKNIFFFLLYIFAIAYIAGASYYFFFGWKIENEILLILKNMTVDNKINVDLLFKKLNITK